MIGPRYLLLLLLALPQSTLGQKDFSPSFARCSLFGDDHIKTFDELLYDFAGDCSYLLAGDCEKRSFLLLGDYHNGKRISLSLYLGEYFEIHLFLNGTVTQGEKRVLVPYTSNGVFLEKEAGYYKLSGEEQGFVAKIDTNGNVLLSLAEKHYNRTCGLCGNFNRFAEDDFMTQEGILEENSYTFANSWGMSNEQKKCQRVVPPSHTCNISEATDQDFIENCQLLRTSSVFSKCHHLVDPEKFVGLCEEDMCRCARERNCHCPVFLEYARSCAQQGVILKGWPASSGCRPACPNGLQYNECTSACAKTCQSLNINEVCPDLCVDGCSCPEGKLLDGDVCVDAPDCSCINAGKKYPPGSSVYQDCNSCICRHGAWVCNNEACPGECSVTGQSHFKSFDNKHFTFSGICHYLFAGDCEGNAFSVFIETVQCADDRDAVCTRSVSVQLQEENFTIKLKHGGGVSVNGQDVQIPFILNALHIQHTVLPAVRLSYKENMHLDWDGLGTLVMKLSSEYTEQICGLCGNYNGNQGDDFLTPSGLVETLVEDFGNSWKLKGDCEDLQKQDSNSCSLNPRLARYADSSCSVLLSPLFAPCHPEVSPSPYLKNCRYDVCSCVDGRDCLCMAVSAYAMACARKGVLIDWRKPEFCAMNCPEGQLYRQCGSPCNQTCRSLGHPDTDCQEFCTEGCFCPLGTYLDQQGDCVPRSQCSCYYDGEIFQPDDVFSDHHTMCYCENGLMHCSSQRLPGSFFPDVLFPVHRSARAKRSVSCKHPMTMFVCPPNDPRAKGVECMKTCQTYNLGCISHGCISGCLCPTGWVRHGNKCVVPENCPCFHNGQEYAPGQTVTKDCNTCTCRARKWECTENICDGKCSVIGTAHYLTFDGLKYRFPGNCQYVLVQDHCEEDVAGSFWILVANEGCGFAKETCTRRITVLFDRGEIELHDGEVNVLTPPREEGNVEILKSGRYYILILGRGRISLSWDQNMGITVILKEHYRDKVCGLCGNFDGIPNNDLRSSRKQIEVDPSDFGNSWKVHSQCADVGKLSQGQDLAASLCNGHAIKQVKVETSCSVLNSDLFKECKKLVDPEPYVEICMYDTCACESIGDCACFCDAIAAYAHVCAQKGAVIHWRSPTLCPQSCESMNKVEEEYLCEWRYNSCGPACPRTCQHMDPISCPVKCVEGCHPHCPAGKILNELSESCIKLEECPVCEVEGHRIADGKKIILNSENSQLCQSCHCEVRNLTCRPCGLEEAGKFLTTVSPDKKEADEMEEEEGEEEEEEEEDTTREYSCSKMMDLAILMDGSNKLSESDFEELKNFTINMMEKLHISQKRIRLAVLEYRTGSHIYLGLKDIKKSKRMKRIVQNIKYTGGNVASATEVLKYVVFHVFGKAPRTNAARIAMIFMASKDPKRIQGIFPILKKKKITVIPVGLGPHVSKEQISLLERQSPENRAFLMNSVLELRQRMDEIIDYFCGLVPEVSVVLSTRRPIPTLPSVHTGTYHPSLTEVPSTQVSISVEKIMDIVFLIEGSGKVGKNNFDTIKEFLIRTIQELEVGEKTIHVSILQYSFTITVEHSFRERQSKELLIKKVREMKFQGGNATNTGQALNFVSEQSFTTNRRTEQVPHLVYMVTANPSTDTIVRPPSDIHIIPIGIRPSVDIQELEELSQSQAPIIIEDFNNLIKEGPDLVLRTCCSKNEICTKPMDVIFLLDGTSDVEEAQFEEMKHFVKAFIEHADVGHSWTQVAVLQYGKVNSLEISWNELQEERNLLKKVDSIHQGEKGPSRLGDAIDFVVQHAISEANGGRPNASKTAVIIVAGTSKDAVEAAVFSARANRVTLLPIGVGTKYNVEQLKSLVGLSAKDKIITLQHFEDLSTMVTLGVEFMKKLCTETAKECIDEEGNIRAPGDKWQLLDPCYSVKCLPSGHTELESHRHLCEKMAKPTCHNNFPAVKVEETCSCRWVCPCTCMGSSTRHIVTFDGLDFKLTGNCSYTLFEDKEEDVEVILHNGACSSAPKVNCMNAIEVTYQGFSLQLYNNMTVTVNGVAVIPPYSNSQVEVNIYGTIMHEVRFLQQNHTLAFTPSNNEFTLQLSPKSFASKMYGLCGVCDQNSGNDLLLKNDSITRDIGGFIQDWTIQQPGGICKERKAEVCVERATGRCSILLSNLFYECHQVIPPNTFYATCEENNCFGEDVCEIVASYAHLCKVHGVCVDWRTPDFCAMPCPASLIYQPCKKGCTKHCENGTDMQICTDYATEGCFCPPGQVVLDGTCVHEDICSQCIGEDGSRHQLLETWIPSINPCKVCMCLENRTVNCVPQPCATAKPIDCGPCEIPRLQRNSNQCCPVFECVCDLISCKLPLIPHCEDGLQLIQTNPGGCRPDYACVCKKEECKPQSTPFCPPHRKPVLVKTRCCDEFQCVCSCNNSTVSCPPGYLSSSITNDCGCTSTTCIPDQVCVHRNIVYPLGMTWEEGCKECSCTHMKDAVTGLRITECLEKGCSTSCPAGYKYVNREGACCGKCLRTMCEDKPLWSRRDEDVVWHNVGSEWTSPTDPCVIKKCIRVNEEVFIQTRNVSCQAREPISCPFATEMRCDQRSGCCPSCRCEPVNGCVLNGTVLAPGKRMLLDECTTCQCTTQQGLFLTYKLTCGKITCEPCPKNYRMEKTSGSCCGKCLPTRCDIQLRDGTILYLKPNETIQDGCDNHFCKVNQKGDFIWERKITGCPPFDSKKCLAEGGKVTKLGSTCCETCVEPECRLATGRLEFVKVDDCVNENQLNLHYCEGKCSSQAIYNITLNRIEDLCSCCSATTADTMRVPLRCANGSLVHHQVFNARECDCLSRKCQP